MHRARLVSSYLFAHEFARPTPAHALTEGAAAAVATVRREGRGARLDRVMAGIVTEHGNPRGASPFEGEVVTAAARRLLRLAEATGWAASLHTLVDRCAVQGRRDDLAFRAYWVEGKADGGTWHEREWRYEMIQDARPVGVNVLTRTGLKGKRPAGVGVVRLQIVGSPLGLPVNITELERRVKA